MNPNSKKTAPKSTESSSQVVHTPVANGSQVGVDEGRDGLPRRDYNRIRSTDFEYLDGAIVLKTAQRLHAWVQAYDKLNPKGISLYKFKEGSTKEEKAASTNERQIPETPQTESKRWNLRRNAFGLNPFSKTMRLNKWIEKVHEFWAMLHEVWTHVNSPTRKYYIPEKLEDFPDVMISPPSAVGAVTESSPHLRSYTRLKVDTERHLRRYLDCLLRQSGEMKSGDKVAKKEILEDIAAACERLGDWHTAIRELKILQTTCEELGDSLSAMRIGQRIAVAQMRAKNHDVALELFDKLIARFSGKNPISAPIVEVSLWDHKVRCHLARKEYQAALDTLNHQHHPERKHGAGSPLRRAACHVLRGRALEGRGEATGGGVKLYKEALKALWLGLRQQYKIGDLTEAANTLIDLARVHLKLGCHLQAIAISSIAIGLSYYVKGAASTLMAHRLRGDIYFDFGELLLSKKGPGQGSHDPGLNNSLFKNAGDLSLLDDLQGLHNCSPGPFYTSTQCFERSYNDYDTCLDIEEHDEARDHIQHAERQLALLRFDAKRYGTRLGTSPGDQFHNGSAALAVS